MNRWTDDILTYGQHTGGKHDNILIVVFGNSEFNLNRKDKNNIVKYCTGPTYQPQVL